MFRLNTASRAQALCALRILHAHGLRDSGLQTIYRAVVVSKLICASSFGVGFTNNIPAKDTSIH